MPRCTIAAQRRKPKPRLSLEVTRAAVAHFARIDALVLELMGTRAALGVTPGSRFWPRMARAAARLGRLFVSRPIAEPSLSFVVGANGDGGEQVGKPLHRIINRGDAR